MHRLPSDLKFASPAALACALGMFAALSLSGCVVGPDYHRPNAPAVDRYTAKALPEKTVSSSAAGGDAQRFLQGRAVPRRWWNAFDSAELNHRVEIALQHSPTIASAQAALRQAQENAKAAGGALFPAINADGGATRAKQSEVGIPTLRGVGPYTLYNASVSVNYTLDLFGGVRRSIESQLAQSDYQQARLDSTYLTLAGNVVTASLQEASLREQIHAIEQIVQMQRQSLGITEKQRQIGAKSLSDTLAVRSLLAATEATLPPLRAQLANTRNQLATYMGTTAAQLAMAPLTLDAVHLPQDIPVSLPSQLVDQRPDIQATSAQLHAAFAQVGVATAAMLPQISLSGSGGSQALHSGNLFSSGTGFWSLGLNLTQPLFHGGQLLHQKRAAQAGLDKAVADWKQTVLIAFQNVADALQALQYDAQTLAAQAVAESTASQQLALTRQQYQLGATGYLNLLNAQRSYQQARINLIQARASRLSDTAALYTALGGGWRGDNAATASNNAVRPSTTPH